MLRATNTGVTAIINERGVVLQQVEVFTTAHGMAQGFAGATPYVRFGNSLVLGLAGMILFAALLPVSRGRRKNL